ncbi:hypothetical protein F4861DRAFT_503140 [Xylaria intraflava]|nr:hypothetical protein F4861DRAFT_503140 [Xylaria intraflava]
MTILLLMLPLALLLMLPMKVGWLLGRLAKPQQDLPRGSAWKGVWRRDAILQVTKQKRWGSVNKQEDGVAGTKIPQI